MAKTLTEIALDEKLAAPAVLEGVAHQAEQADEPLVVALIRRAGIGEVALVAALRRQTRVAVTDPATIALDSDALREVGREVCRRRRVLPLSVQVHHSGPRTLILAMADPTDHVAMAEVEHLTGCRVEPTLMTLSAVEELIETGYRGFVTQVMKREDKPVYGADLSVKTSRSAAPAAVQGVAAQPTTNPYHRVADEAAPSVRHRALVKLLVDKGVITEAELDATVRKLLKGRDDGG